MAKKRRFDPLREVAADDAERRAEKREKQKDRSQVICPDCGAWLEITSQSELPDDIKIEFIKHRV